MKRKQKFPNRAVAEQKHTSDTEEGSVEVRMSSSQAVKRRLAKGDYTVEELRWVAERDKKSSRRARWDSDIAQDARTDGLSLYAADVRAIRAQLSQGGIASEDEEAKNCTHKVEKGEMDGREMEAQSSREDPASQEGGGAERKRKREIRVS